MWGGQGPAVWLFGCRGVVGGVCASLTVGHQYATKQPLTHVPAQAMLHIAPALDLA